MVTVALWFPGILLQVFSFILSTYTAAVPLHYMVYNES